MHLPDFRCVIVIIESCTPLQGRCEAQLVTARPLTTILFLCAELANNINFRIILIIRLILVPIVRSSSKETVNMDEPVQRVDRIFNYDDGHTEQVLHVSVSTIVSTIILSDRLRIV